MESMEAPRLWRLVQDDSGKRKGQKKFPRIGGPSNERCTEVARKSRMTNFIVYFRKFCVCVFLENNET